MHKPSILILLLFSTVTASWAQADIAIIANKSFPIDSIDKSTAEKLWLGKIHKLPEVGKIKVVDQSSSNTIKETFYKKLAGKTPDQLKTYWAKVIFTGKAFPPKVLSSDQKVRDKVSKSKNILGYISSQSVTDDIKVLMTIK